ncbi:hypothetical protein F4825DRAFT_359590 [Nemania diffusa]|nr:hypothetical protein F4825DRAFT_359590 [Nemania diffusa]
MDGERTGERVGERRNGDKEKEKERERDREGSKEGGMDSRDPDRDSDTSATAAQSRRPPYHRRDTGNGSDSQVSQQQLPQLPQQPQQQHQQQQQRSKQHQKRVVGGGAGRFHARVPSSKGLHKSHSQSTTAKLRSRASSPEPEQQQQRPSLAAHPHRRTTSDLRLTAATVAAAVALASPAGISPNSNANPSSLKNASHSNLAAKRNRSHVEISKRSKSAANIKRSSSHKDVQKLKGPKNQVHFDLGNDENDDENEDEWVDASASASPYLSRRSSVVSSRQSPAKPPSPSGSASRPQTPHLADGHSPERHTPSSPTRQIAQRNSYITSRLLQRTSSHGAPPKMSTETVSVPPPSGSPTSQVSRGPPSLYGTPKPSALGGSGPEELVSRFVNGSGPSSGGHGESDSYFIPAHEPVQRNEGGVRRPQSLSNLNQASASRDSASEEDESVLATRSRQSTYKVVPASQSRTQQKLNLQRASSTIEPAQTAPGVGAVGSSLLVSSTDYDHRDPRIGKLLERTGMEYLVVRRYQNPIARSIARLSHLPGANKNQRIPRQPGTNVTPRGKPSRDLGAADRLGLSQSLTNIARSRPVTPRRPTSIRALGPRSSYTGDDERLHEGLSGSSYGEENDDGLDALLRNLWDKSTDLSASQD